MQNALYAEINLMCVAMLLLACHLFSFERTKAKLVLLNVFIAEMLFFLSDTAAVLLEGTGAPSGWSYLADAVYFICSVLCPYEWMRYVIFELGAPVSGQRRAFSAVPALLVAALAVLAPFTGWLFRIGAENAYARGPLYPVQPVVSFAYLVFSSVVCLRAGKRAVTHDVRRKAAVLGMFVYFPLIAMLLDIVTDGVPFVCPVTTIALTFVYISLQRHAVTKDALTGVNNRYELQRYMDAQRSDRDGNLWIFMIDIDDFKRINDTEGHAAGDEALKCAAGAMSRLAGERDFFFARYGGDEFAAVAECRDEHEAETLRNNLKEAVREAGRAMKLTVSAGKAKCEAARSWERSLAAADEDLYRDKKHKTAPGA